MVGTGATVYVRPIDWTWYSASNSRNSRRSSIAAAAMDDVSTTPMHPRAPSLYVAHGLPSYALDGYPVAHGLADAQTYVDMLRSLPEKFAPPKAIVCMSGHWVTDGAGVKVTSAARPKMIYEFYGFPKELYDVQYPAPGDPSLAEDIRRLAAEAGTGLHVGDEPNWGLDHGAWTLLVHLFPNADIPVLELSVDGHRPAEYYFRLGRQLRSLRDRGVMLMGSGSIVHNLRRLNWGGGPHPWAKAFNDFVVHHTMKTRDVDALLRYEEAPGGLQSVPEPSHYYPFIFALGASHDDEERVKLIDWIDNGSNGMTSFSFGV